MGSRRRSGEEHGHGHGGRHAGDGAEDDADDDAEQATAMYSGRSRRGSSNPMNHTSLSLVENEAQGRNLNGEETGGAGVIANAVPNTTLIIRQATTEMIRLVMWYLGFSTAPCWQTGC